MPFDIDSQTNEFGSEMVSAVKLLFLSSSHRCPRGRPLRGPRLRLRVHGVVPASQGQEERGHQGIPGQVLSQDTLVW